MRWRTFQSVTKADKNGQEKTQTVHVALRKTLVQRLKAMAALNRRSLNAQVALLVERQFAKESING